MSAHDSASLILWTEVLAGMIIGTSVGIVLLNMLDRLDARRTRHRRLKERNKCLNIVILTDREIMRLRENKTRSTG